MLGISANQSTAGFSKTAADFSKAAADWFARKSSKKFTKANSTIVLDGNLVDAPQRKLIDVLDRNFFPCITWICFEHLGQIF